LPSGPPPPTPPPPHLPTDATAEGVLPPDGQGLFLRPLTLTAAEGQASTAWGVVGSQYAISASSTSSKPAVAAGGSSGMPTPSTPAAAAGSSAAGSSPLLPGGVAAGAALLLALQRMQPAQVLEEIPVAVQAVMEGPNQQQQAMAALVGAGRPAVECWVEALVPEDTRSRDEVVGQVSSRVSPAGLHHETPLVGRVSLSCSKVQYTSLNTNSARLCV
jgi:hypothetical protein